MKQFYTNLFIVQTKDIDEIKRTLDNVTINQYPLNTKEESALMIIADVANLEKILKVMRSFNANPFSIPEGVEQVPTKAYATAELKIKEFEEKHKKVTKEIAKMIAKIRQDILTLHERASVAKDVLELLRKPGGTKNFAVVQGYIPKKMEKKFKDTTGKWMSIVEDVSDPELSKKRPTLFDNKIFVRTFEVITQSQGIPKKRRSRSNTNDCIDVANFLWINVCRCRSRIITNGIRINFQTKRTRKSFQMGNANCNFRCRCCNSGSGNWRSVWIPHKLL